MQDMHDKEISNVPVHEGIARPDELTCPDLHIEANYLVMFLNWVKFKGPLKEWTFVFFAGWVIPCVLAHWDGVLLPGGELGTKCFLFDLTMLSFFLLGVPIIVIAGPKLNDSLGCVLRYSVRNRIFTVPPEQLEKIVDETRRWSESIVLHCSAIFIAYELTALWLTTTLYDGIDTWHLNGEPQLGAITTSAWYVCVLSYPAALYIFISWGLKFCLFLRLLFKITRYGLRVSPLHPDRCGGLSFFGRASSAWGFLILAVGFCTVFDFINSVSIQNAGPTRWDLVAKMAAYLVLGPAFLFTQNLFFARHLYAAKHKFLNELSELGAIRSDNLYKKMTKRLSEEEGTSDRKFKDGFDELSDFEHAYNRVRSMRLWPFDLGTLTRYTLAVTTPLVSLILPYVPDWMGAFVDSLR